MAKRITKQWTYRKNRTLIIDIVNHSFIVKQGKNRVFANTEDIMKFNYYIEQLEWDELITNK